MSDTTVTTTSPTPPPPMMNDEAARSLTGEIIDQAAATPSTPTQTQSETKPDASTEGETKTETKPETKPEVPEAYSFTAPEGYSLDPKLVESVTPMFKEMGLTQDQAQKLFDFHTAQMLEAAKAPESTYTQMRNEWLSKAKADPDMAKANVDGKTGLDAVKVDIGRALSALGDASLVSDFRDAMNLTGAGDHPAMIKALWRLSAYVTEGKHVAGAGPSEHGQRAPGQGGRPDPAKSMYPNLP